MTEREKFLAWYRRERKERGLLAMHIATSAIAGLPVDASVEDIYRALNEMNAAVERGEAVPLTGI